MARIQTPQHVQELQAEFKVREQFGLELLETVQPVYSLGRQKVASLGYPRKCMGHVSVTGGVGDHGELIITCPADVGIVINVDKIWVTDVAGEFGLRITDGVAPTDIVAASTNKAFRDGRIIDQLPDGILQSASPLAAAANGRRMAILENPAGETTQFDVDVILGGGAYFLLRNSTLNALITCAFLWTEFLLEDR